MSGRPPLGVVASALAVLADAAFGKPAVSCGGRAGHCSAALAAVFGAWPMLGRPRPAWCRGADLVRAGQRRRGQPPWNSEYHWHGLTGSRATPYVLAGLWRVRRAVLARRSLPADRATARRPAAGRAVPGYRPVRRPADSPGLSTAREGKTMRCALDHSEPAAHLLGGVAAEIGGTAAWNRSEASRRPQRGQQRRLHRVRGHHRVVGLPGDRHEAQAERARGGQDAQARVSTARGHGRRHRQGVGAFGRNRPRPPVRCRAGPVRMVEQHPGARTAPPVDVPAPGLRRGRRAAAEPEPGRRTRRSAPGRGAPAGPRRRRRRRGPAGRRASCTRRWPGPAGARPGGTAVAERDQPPSEPAFTGARVTAGSSARSADAARSSTRSSKPIATIVRSISSRLRSSAMSTSSPGWCPSCPHRHDQQPVGADQGGEHPGATGQRRGDHGAADHT